MNGPRALRRRLLRLLELGIDHNSTAATVRQLQCRLQFWINMNTVPVAVVGGRRGASGNLLAQVGNVNTVSLHGGVGLSAHHPVAASEVWIDENPRGGR